MARKGRMKSNFLPRRGRFLPRRGIFLPRHPFDGAFKAVYRTPVFGGAPTSLADSNCGEYGERGYMLCVRLPASHRSKAISFGADHWVFVFHQLPSSKRIAYLCKADGVSSWPIGFVAIGIRAWSCTLCLPLQGRRASCFAARSLSSFPIFQSSLL